MDYLGEFISQYITVNNILWLVFIVFILFGWNALQLYRMKGKGNKVQAKLHAAFQVLYFDRLLARFPDAAQKIDFLTKSFIIPPNERDPNKLMDVILRNSRTGRRLMVKEMKKLMPNADYKTILQYGTLLSVAVELRFLYRMFRHNMKLGWYHYIFPFQAVALHKMFLEYKDALMGAYEAFENEQMIGDSIGPYAVTELAKSYGITDWKLDEDSDMYYCRTDDKLFVRAHQFTTGDIIEFIEGHPVSQKFRYYKKLVTIDAGLKLLGVQTGEVVKAIGVACGGSGAERRFMEHTGMETIAFIIKMWITEAYGGMRNGGYSEMIVDHRGKWQKFLDWVHKRAMIPENIMREMDLLISELRDELDDDMPTIVIGIGNAGGLPMHICDCELCIADGGT
ncbi:MAG: DUF1512 family protein, partial [Planctomycetota bacterium]